MRKAHSPPDFADDECRTNPGRFEPDGRRHRQQVEYWRGRRVICRPDLRKQPRDKLQPDSSLRSHRWRRETENEWSNLASDEEYMDQYKESGREHGTPESIPCQRDRASQMNPCTR